MAVQLISLGSISEHLALQLVGCHATHYVFTRPLTAAGQWPPGHSLRRFCAVAQCCLISHQVVLMNSVELQGEKSTEAANRVVQLLNIEQPFNAEMKYDTHGELRPAI